MESSKQMITALKQRVGERSPCDCQRAFFGCWGYHLDGLDDLYPLEEAVVMVMMVTMVVLVMTTMVVTMAGHIMGGL